MSGQFLEKGTKTISNLSTRLHPSVRFTDHVPPLAAVKIVRPRARCCGRSILTADCAAESWRRSNRWARCEREEVMNFGLCLMRSYRKRWECRGVRAMLAEQSSRSVMRRKIRDAKQRQVPAKTFNAVPIRGYQSGQPPCPLARTPQHSHFLRGPPWARGFDRTFHINGYGVQRRRLGEAQPVVRCNALFYGISS